MIQKRKRSRHASAAVGVALALGLTAFAGAASAQDIGERRPIEDNSGPGFAASPSAYFPSRGDTGFAVDANATYGIPVSPFVIAPGGRFAAYFGHDGAVTGMPMVEAKLPIGGVVPYLKAGAGIGHATANDEAGLSLMGGGGINVQVTDDAFVGVDATYENVAGTGFKSLAIGPRAELRY